MGRPWDKQMRADAAPSCWKIMIARLSFACATTTPLARRRGLSHYHCIRMSSVGTISEVLTLSNMAKLPKRHGKPLRAPFSGFTQPDFLEAELARALLQIIASKNLAKALRVLRKIIWYGPPKHWLCDPAMFFCLMG